MFKVGDIVKVVGSENNYSAKFLGELGKVTEIDKDQLRGGYCILDIEGKRNQGGLWDTELRLATGLERQEYYNSRRKAKVMEEK